MAFFQSAITVVLFLFILGALVVIHELGHFITARLAGVRVLEFGIGFPPRAKVLRSSGETLYTLNWLPIGGFVKLEGEDGDAADDPRSFSHAPLVKKLVILVAGVAMNVLLAFVIFTSIAAFATPYVGVKFLTVEQGSPAAQAGITAPGALLAVDGQRYDYFSGFRGESVLDAIRAKAGDTVVVTISDASGATRAVTVHLRSPSEVDDEHGTLGISSRGGWQLEFAGGYTGHDLPTAVSIGADQTVRAVSLVLDGLGQLVSSVATNPSAAPPVAGPVGIARQVGDLFWNSGPVLTLYFAGILSANLALVNILPFPPLDGGRMLMIVLRSLFGARISVRAERLTYAIGFLFLFGFLIWVTGFDILRGIQGG
jgi:regulator of sigma E protease